jgi:2-oxoglutarate dehydrogenase complex dehydrogenase (E1) component-like enzyme
MILVSEEELKMRSKYSNFYRFVSAYREHGHKQANIDPISLSKAQPLPELRPEHFGLDLADNVPLQGILHVKKSEGTVSEAVDILKSIYSSTMSAEFSHLEVKNRAHY